jgi:hypothetical protein
MLGKVFEKFIDKAPVAVMVRGVLERVLNPDALNDIYTQLMPDFRFYHRPVMAKFSVSNERSSWWYCCGLLKNSSHTLRNVSNDS